MDMIIAQVFPDTVEEFMEQNKMVDEDHVYSNGVEYVPIFRMMQWFEHRPERKKGKWIKGVGENGVSTSLFCSECNLENRHWYEWNYCPNCGAEMERE